MLRSLISGISGLKSFQLGMDNIGNNIANVKTNGYKSSRVTFADTFAQTIGNNGTDNTTLKQVGTGVGVHSVQSTHTVGTLEETGRSGDMAIDGEGYFVVRNTRTGEEFLTRDGNFTRTSDGYLETPSGLRLQGFSNEALDTIGDVRVAVPSNASPDAKFDTWSVAPSGEIRVFMSDATSGVVGQVLLQRVQNPDALKLEGQNLYSRSDLAGAMDWATDPGRPGSDNALGDLRWKYLELSNVELGNEFSNMITNQRAYQASARLITTSDEMLQELVNLKR